MNILKNYAQLYYRNIMKLKKKHLSIYCEMAVTVATATYDDSLLYNFVDTDTLNNNFHIIRKRSNLLYV